MTGHAHAVVADVQRCVAELPKDDPRAALTEVVLGEAAGRLSQPFTGTMACVQHRARLARPVRAARQAGRRQGRGPDMSGRHAAAGADGRLVGGLLAAADVPGIAFVGWCAAAELPAGHADSLVSAEDPPVRPRVPAANGGDQPLPCGLGGRRP
ncbi:hypothetical protein [Streptomyces sp. NPDC051129]|uniref:hypothetical protein n=1 Tax=Streptomyces sp. NPDC051129 TaxID=3154639 RepID=UPI00342E06E7